MRAQLRSASGMRSKVIKDRQRVEVTVEVPGAGKLVLIVDSKGQYILRTSSEGDEASAGAQLVTGKLHTAEHEPA
jgi:HSP20 family molecular chaperone IbpA